MASEPRRRRAVPRPEGAVPAAAREAQDVAGAASPPCAPR